jgi:putative iron-regulated protein
MKSFKQTLVMLSALTLLHAARADVLTSFSRELMLSTYATLAERCETLASAVSSAVEQPSAETVDAARVAWKAAREPWESSEAFLFGPVDTEGHDPLLDSWPVNLTDLQKVLDDAGASVDGEALKELGEGFTGFHVVEYFLFADPSGTPVDSQAVADQLRADPRRARYLAASARQMQQQAAALLADYDATGNNFIRHVSGAGVDSDLYVSKEAVLDEVVMAMVGILEEIRTAKLLEPAETGDASLLESRFSANTTDDIGNNLKGVTMSFGTVVEPLMGDASTEILAALSSASDAVARIPADQFNTDPGAVLDSVTEAAQSVGHVQQLLEAHVVPRIAELSQQL